MNSCGLPRAFFVPVGFCRRLPLSVCVVLLALGFLQWFSGKESPCNARDTGDVGWKDPLEEGMETHSSILA